MKQSAAAGKVADDEGEVSKARPGGGIRNWHISDPDAEGQVWFHWTGAGPKESFRLGPEDAVGEKLASKLEQWDFGER